MENITNDTDVLQKTPGQILKTAREDSGISIAEASQALLLNKSIINALEADDYSGIVAKVYAEGYLKAYAAYLQLPVSTVLESFGRLNVYGENEIRPIRMARGNTEISDSIKNINKLFLALKDKKSITLLAIFAGLVCLVLMVVIIKKVSVKAPQESILSTNNITVVPAFPITVSSNLVSMPQIEQTEALKDNQKTKKNKSKNKPKIEPKSEPELLDKGPEDLNDNVAQ